MVSLYERHQTYRDKMENALVTLKDTTLETLLKLHASVDIYINDFFGYASSFVFSMEASEIPIITKLYQNFGYEGVYALFAVQGDLTPIKGVASDKYFSAEKYIKENKILDERIEYLRKETEAKMCEKYSMEDLGKQFYEFYSNKIWIILSCLILFNRYQFNFEN